MATATPPLPDTLPGPAPGTGPGDDSPEAWLHRLDWTVLRRLDGLLQGPYRTLWRGAGLDLADLREYQPQDDVRHIDWNVTARLQVPHVRQFTEDRELTAWFLLDLSGSLDFGSVAATAAPGGADPAAALRTKRALASGFVGAVARLLTRQGNRVGALLYRPGQPLQVMPPAAGRGAVLQLLARLRQPAPEPTPRPPRPARQRRAATAEAPLPAGTRLDEVLQQAAGLLKRRSMVFVLSDFISAPGWAEPLGRLVRRHEVLALRLYDPAEMALPDIGLVTLQDAETGEQIVVDTQDEAFRTRYAALADAAEAQLREALARAGSDTMELATGDALLPALLRLVLMRRMRQRLPSGQGLGRTLGRALDTLTEAPAP